MGYEPFSRTLNGVIATLGTAEWTMHSIFHEMSLQNLRRQNYTAILRNKLIIRLKGKWLSPFLIEFLKNHEEVVEAVVNVDCVVFILSLLNHQKHVELSYDNILFLMNRIEIFDKELMNLEDKELSEELTSKLHAWFKLSLNHTGS